MESPEPPIPAKFFDEYGRLARSSSAFKAFLGSTSGVLDATVHNTAHKGQRILVLSIAAWNPQECKERILSPAVRKAQAEGWLLIHEIKSPPGAFVAQSAHSTP
jgi:hypothetical protein